MKKIIFIILFCLLFSNTKIFVKAKNQEEELKPLVVTKGSNPTLDLEGYHLISDIPSFDFVGNYVLTYQKNGSSKTKIRNVEVVEIDTLEKKEYFKNALALKINESMDVNKVIELKDTKDSFAALIRNSNGYEMLFIRDVIFQTKVSMLKNLTMKDITYDEEEDMIYGLGEIYNVSEGLNLYLFKMNSNGTILIERTYGGSLNEEANFVKTLDDTILIGCRTRSNDGKFQIANRLDFDSYILEIDKNTFELTNAVNIGVEGNDEITAFTTCPTLTILESYFVNGMNQNRLITFDSDNDLTNYKSQVLPTFYPLSNVSLAGNNDQIYLAFNEYSPLYNDTMCTVYSYKNNILKLIEKTYNEGEKIKNIYLKNDTLYILLEKKESLSSSPYVYVKTTNELTSTKILVEDLMYSQIIENTNKLFIVDRTSFQIFEYLFLYGINLSSDIADSNYQEPTIYNNEKALHLNKELSNEYYNPQSFGTYHVNYYYEGDYVDFCISKNITVPLDTNMKDDEVYNLGLKISFNGKATLNNFVIESGYEVQSPGLYELTLEGYQDEKVMIRFEVADLVDHQMTFNALSKISMTKLEKALNKDEEITLKQEKAVLLKEGFNYQKDLWYVLIPVSSSLITLCIFFFVRRKLI